jgi:WXXGXW repeat (2 copies)
MKRFRSYGLTGALLGVMLLGSCGHGHYYVGVAYGPPAPIVEEPYGVAPGPYYVWTPGFYDFVGGTWVWRRGTWRRRPHPVDRWVAPRWEHEGNGYRFHEGGWQHGNRFHH